MLKITYAGESHGRAIVTIISGIPAGLELTAGDIDKELWRRQQGYGRGKRMNIEQDRAEILSGVLDKKTIGSPIAVEVKNRDFSIDNQPPITVARPGHADLSGALKYNQKNIRSILERASARTTVGYVCAGAVAKKLLTEFAIEIFSYVEQIGKVKARVSPDKIISAKKNFWENTELRCPDKIATAEMMKLIDRAKDNGDTLGGTFRLIARGLCPGLGSYVRPNERLDGRIAGALMAIPAIKGVEIGAGFKSAEISGKNFHDEIFYSPGKGFYRLQNNAGGLEGGISNGEPLIIRAAMKPIPTLAKPLHSVDIVTGKAARAPVLRADVCAVSAAAVIAESVLAIEIAGALIEKFGGDNLSDMKKNYDYYRKRINNKKVR